MLYYKTQEEIELIRESSLLVSKALAEVAREIRPGITSLSLDKIAEEFIRDHGGEPAFLVADAHRNPRRLLERRHGRTPGGARLGPHPGGPEDYRAARSGRMNTNHRGDLRL